MYSRLVLALGALLGALLVVLVYFMVVYAGGEDAYLRGAFRTGSLAEIAKDEATMAKSMKTFTLLLWVGLGICASMLGLIVFVVFVSYQVCSHINGLRFCVYLIG
jgi:hypothetical protein